jgi:hypothetical protein
MSEIGIFRELTFCPCAEAFADSSYMEIHFIGQDTSTPYEAGLSVFTCTVTAFIRTSVKSNATFSWFDSLNRHSHSGHFRLSG